jgi:nucleotide-binding universal stress UspA family protein
VGPVWQAIVDTARERDAAVIVMGARGLTGVQHVLLGSVSERVVRHADRPVLVLRPSPGSS